MNGAEAVQTAPVVVPHKSKLRKRLKWLVLAGCALAIVVSLASRARKAGSNARLDKALVAAVRKGTLEVLVLETGRIEPRAQAQVKSRVGGQVTEVTVDEGQKVAVGQVL